MSSVGGSPGRCFLKTSTSASSSRVEGSFSSVFWMYGFAASSNSARIASFVRRVEREPGRRVLGRQRAQQRGDRQLALAVDARVDDALLVDLELEPRAARRHQVRGEDLLRRVLRLHQIGARRAHELRDDHALGAVDDERPVLGHHREVAHEDALLADLARLRVHEADGHRERRLVGEVLLTTLGDRVLRRAELVVAELDRQRAGVVGDRRDVVDRSRAGPPPGTTGRTPSGCRSGWGGRGRASGAKTTCARAAQLRCCSRTASLSNGGR